MKYESAGLGILVALIACKQPAPERDPLRVEVVRVSRGDAASTFEATGEVRARLESDLSFRVGGKVIERNHDVGDHVAANALLARLDPQQQRAGVDVAKAALDSAQAALANAELELKREKNLYAQQATAKASLDAQEEATMVARGAVASARAGLTEANEQLRYTELRAPHAGVVTTRAIEVGQVVQPTAPAYGFSEETGRDAVFHVQENIAARLDTSTLLELHLTDKPDVRASGKVREISPVVDAKTASIMVKVTIENPPAAMDLRAPIIASMKLNATQTVTLPAWAMFADAEGRPAVWVVNEADKRVEIRRVDVVSFESKNIVVREGLKDGELVVSRGASRLRPTVPVVYEEKSRS